MRVVLQSIFQYLRLKHAYTAQAQAVELKVYSNYVLERILTSRVRKG